jgi:septum formation protein
VITAVCIQDAQKKRVFHDITHVSFHALSAEQIIHYVDNYKPYDKAGAYAIQEWIGVIGIQSIEGDFYNVMGLPISRLVHVLNESFY